MIDSYGYGYEDGQAEMWALIEIVHRFMYPKHPEVSLCEYARCGYRPFALMKRQRED